MDATFEVLYRFTEPRYRRVYKVRASGKFYFENKARLFQVHGGKPSSFSSPSTLTLAPHALPVTNSSPLDAPVCSIVPRTCSAPELLNFVPTTTSKMHDYDEPVECFIDGT